MPSKVASPESFRGWLCICWLLSFLGAAIEYGVPRAMLVGGILGLIVGRQLFPTWSMDMRTKEDIDK